MDFKQKLKAVYKRQDKIAPLIEGLEGEIPQQTLDDYYVKLKTIIKEDDDKKQGNYETIFGQKKEVEIEDIFNQPSIRRLLILGGAGVGKSTLMQYMAYKWSTSNLWKDKFDYVYRVTLKTLLNAGWDRDYDKNERQDELKCLVHYNLVSQGGEKGLKLKDMPWQEKKDKVLLLLDGYDEVAHERNGLYKKLFENIFEHKNIILTSRPNAIDKQMAQKFGKKIENTGLDYQGIEKYLSQYFRNKQEKGEALKEFLNKNTSIKEICHIPVNIAMMCFIWSEGDSNSTLHEISNMSDLYKQVVDQLGFRYFAKTNPKQNQDELMSKWRGGEIYLDELQILEHTAYKGMTGGGLQVSEDKRFETLIIKGFTKKGDKDGISIQSSINYLRDQLKKDMPTINKVYKYGLLKPEGVVRENSQKELSETDLQEQSFSFIHLSFQEFLTALYLVQNLLKENNKEEQERIANFIAQHRNEPRYLMTLKLMAGILSADDGENCEQAIKIFWDSILCTPDGVLELGVEAKVTLLMHLLGQAKKDDIIDKRIPNGNLAVDLIDSVVLQDLATWGPQLKESDYISPNIKEGLIQFFIKDNKDWMSDKSSRLQEIFTKQTKKPHPITIEAVIEIISSIINKFSQDEQDQISLKFVQLIKNHNETTWQLTKKAIEAITTLHQKSKLNLDNTISKEELLDAFLVTVYDSNLTELSLKAMQDILNIQAEGSSLVDRLNTNIKEPQANMPADVFIKTKYKLLKIVHHDTQFIRDFINTSLVPILEDPIADVVILASNMMSKLATSSTDKQLVLDVLNLLLPFIQYEECSDSVSADIKILAKTGSYQQPIQDRINTLIPLLQDRDLDTVKDAVYEIRQLIKIQEGSIDIQKLLSITKLLIQANTAFGMLEKIPLWKEIKEFMKVTCQNNSQTAKALIKAHIGLFEKPSHQLQMEIWGLNTMIIELIDNDIQFSKDIINIMVPILKSPKITLVKNSTGYFAFNQIKSILKNKTELCKYVLDAFTPLLQSSDTDIFKTASQIILDTVRIDPRLAKDVIKIMVPFFKHPDNRTREEIVSSANEILKSYLIQELQFMTEFILQSLIPRLQDSDQGVKGTAFFLIRELIRHLKDYDIHFLRDVTKAIIPLLKDSDQNVRAGVANQLKIIISISKKRDTQLIREIIKALTPMLQDPDSNVKIQVSISIIKLTNLDDNSDVQFRKDILNSLTPLLQDPEQSEKSSVLKKIPKLIQISPQLCQDAIDIMTPLLQDSDPQTQSTILQSLIRIARIDATLLRQVFNLQSQALKDLDQEVKDFALLHLIELVKIADNSDPQLPRDVLNLLSPFSSNVEMQTLKNLSALAKNNPNDIQFSRDIITLLTPALQDDKTEIREKALIDILEISKLHNKDIELIKHIIELLTPFIKDCSAENKGLVCAVHIRDLLEQNGKTDPRLTQNAFDLVISLLQESNRFRIGAPRQIFEFVQKVDTQLSRKAIEAFIPYLKDPDNQVKRTILENIPDLIKLNNPDPAFIKGIFNSFVPLLEGSEDIIRKALSNGITEIAIFADDNQLAKDAIKMLVPLFKKRDHIADSIIDNVQKLCSNRDIQFLKDILDNCLVPAAKEEKRDKSLVSWAMRYVINSNKELINKDILSRTVIPLHNVDDITRLLNANVGTDGHTQLVKEVIEDLAPIFQNSDRISDSQCIFNLLIRVADVQMIKDAITKILSPHFQHSDSKVVNTALKALQSVFHMLLLTPDIFAQYLTHSSKNLRNTVVGFLLTHLEKYLSDFQVLDQLFQHPLSDLSVDIILEKLFKKGGKTESLSENIQGYLDKGHEEQLRSFLVSEINKIKTLKGPVIIELAMAAIGQEKVFKDASDHQKLIELAKEVLKIQLRYLNEEGLIWINQNCEKLLSLSAEAKVFYKKVYHQLLEDGKISSLEEELLIKFINQGLTTSLTRDGQIIFEGKRYKLKGDNIDLTLEKIAKTVIEQQQDILALQYKQHEPIFKISHMKGGMKQAASDIKELKSIVDSRHPLKIESWLLTKLKSLKFNSEVFLLEQRSAFGDHIIYHFSQQKLIQFYPNETPALQEIFGSYIYGEAYQGEVFELTDKVGENLLENKEEKLSKIQIDGKLKSKQIYFQQELLKQGNEDRNSAVEEELAKKLDNNRAVLTAKLKSFNLKENEKNVIEDYFEGFVSTFSSVYTSSQAIDSGKLSIDDGEDFFSPVNLFIQLSSLAPFGIGDVLSSGLEAARSYIKSNEIKNEAKFVKDFAIDAVELSDLVSKIALNLVSNKDQRKRILEAKDDEESNTLINKVKNIVMEKIEKLKNLAEKYSKMKNLFEKEVETSPAFRLGESDANKILKEWIDLKQTQPDFKMKPEDKQKKFVKTITDELGRGNKITPLPTSPQQVSDKTGCCEIF